MTFYGLVINNQTSELEDSFAQVILFDGCEIASFIAKSIQVPCLQHNLSFFHAFSNFF